MIKSTKEIKLAIIGLGYVGLPLALEFSKKRNVMGYDIQHKRIKDLESGVDKNLEVSKKELLEAKKLSLTSNVQNLESSNCYIIAVPTPIDKNKKPDLKLLFLNSILIISMLLPYLMRQHQLLQHQKNLVALFFW